MNTPDQSTQASGPSFPKLSEHNYHTWKFDMQALLQRNGTWAIVKGTVTESTMQDTEKWTQGNWNAAGIMYSHLESKIQPLVREHLDSAKGMWDKLKSQYAEDSAAGRFLILDEFLSIAKQPDESLTALCARVEDALQKVKASCTAEMTLSAFQDEMAMMTLIRALPDEFSSFRSSLLLIPGSLELKTVKEAFLQEERNRQPRASEQLAMRAFSSSSSSSNRPRRAGRYNGPACTYPGCKSPSSHPLDRCYTRAQAMKNEAEKVLGGRKAKQGAKQAEEAKPAEAAEFAGNASALDPSDPLSPLVSDAGADWIADTGATSHMTPHRHWFLSYKPDKRPIRLADEKVVFSVGIGSVRFSPVIKGQKRRLLEFHDVLHVPSLRSNLLSVLSLTRLKQYTVFITGEIMEFRRLSQLLFTATINSNNSAFLDGQVEPMTQFAGRVSTCSLDASLWHRRFCHLNKEDVGRVMNGKLVSGVAVESKAAMDPICEPCIAGKQHRIAVPRIAQNRSSAPLELVHSDVHGPLPVRSRHHYRYWITFIDDFSRFWAVLPLKDKSGAFAAFKQFKALVEKQLGRPIKALRDDKGGEYMSTEWESFCSANGIQRQHTVRAEPHQNGVAERANRTLHEGIISMLNESKLPGSFWWDAVAAFVHVHNRSPTSANEQHGTPFERWHGTKPDVSHFRVFGCTSYVHVKKDKRQQLQPHFEKCVFIGYPAQYKAWLFWNPVTRKEVISNTAEFDERFFPGNSSNPIHWPLSPQSSSLSTDPVDQVGVDDLGAPMRLSVFPEPEVKPDETEQPEQQPATPPMPTRPETPPTSPVTP